MSSQPRTDELLTPATAPPLSRPAELVPPRPGFERRHVLALLAGLSCYVAWQVQQGDLWLADRLYALEGQAWVLRDAPMLQQVFHLLGRELSTLAWLVALAAWLVSVARAGLARLRRPLAYLLSATALSAGSVAWIKSWSNMDCPWDLARYGGSHAYLGLFQARPVAWGHGACFPAGHASAGYMWLALYFFLVQVRPAWRRWGLGLALVAGLLFGGAQQLRGAHFLSHDLATALLCWTVALCLSAAFWPRRGQQHAGAQA